MTESRPRQRAGGESKSTDGGGGGAAGSRPSSGPAGSQSSSEPAAGAVAGSRPSSGTRSLTVLYVDDEPELAVLVATFLERVDDRLTVVTETEVDAALDRIEDGEPDCVVGGYEPRWVDGPVLLRATKACRPDLPFVMFSWRPREELPAADAAALDGYLRKDYELRQCEPLVERIRDAVEVAEDGTR